jgi:hypothetical protein
VSEISRGPEMEQPVSGNGRRKIKDEMNNPVDLMQEEVTI